MQKIVPELRQRPFLFVSLLLPLVLLSALRFIPDWDIPAWGLTWNTRLVHYYVTSFASFIALVLALFASSALGSSSKPRLLFVTLAFAAIAALLLLDGISTPLVLLPGTTNEVFRWSLRLGLPIGALFFSVGGIQWDTRAEEKIIRNRHILWLGCAALYGLFIVTAFGYAAPLTYISSSPLDPMIKFMLGILTIVLLLWSAWRSWVISPQNPLVEKRLAIAMLLLAEAQLCLIMGEWGRLSWLLHKPLTLAGLTVALSAILQTLQAARDVQAARYFAALGSILIVGLSLVSGELGARWLESISRSSVVTMALIQGGLSFLILYSIVVHLDRLITERTEALHQEQQLRADLTQVIVHDLKNPLTVITSGISLLTKPHTGPLNDLQTRLLANLQSASQDTLRLINDLLDVERLETGTLQLQKSSVDLGRMLQTQVTKAQIPATVSRQTLSLSLPESLPCLVADKDLLERVMSNLLSNALKFAPEGGEIQVKAEYQGRRLCIYVEDNGPGVPETYRKRIFEKFGQVKGTERRGAGLGLTFCRMVVEAHNGRILVSNSSLGGALFEVMLPVKSETEPARIPALGQL